MTFGEKIYEPSLGPAEKNSNQKEKEKGVERSALSAIFTSLIAHVKVGHRRRAIRETAGSLSLLVQVPVLVPTTQLLIKSAK